MGWPLILEVHGGPHGCWGWTLHTEFQALAAQGYAVLYVNPRGSHSYNPEFTRACVGDWGGKDFRDLMAAVDMALDRFPWIDPDRLGVTGNSYGGFMTSWIVGTSDRFKAAVVQGVEEMIRRSPVFLAEDVTCPVLVIHAEEDHRCPIGQGEELYTALKAHGKVAAFVRYPGEDHLVASKGKPRNRVFRRALPACWRRRGACWQRIDAGMLETDKTQGGESGWMQGSWLGEYDVVIVGGGVAGGAMASAMASRDSAARILLVEQSAKHGSINRGDLLWPPLLEVLERWGALAEIRKRGAVPMRTNELYDNDGTLLMRTDLSLFASAFDHALALEHPLIEEALLAVATNNPNLTIWRGTRFAGIEAQSATGVVVRLQRNGEEVLVRAGWLVGADGRNSRVRQAAGIDSPMKPYGYEFLVARTPVQERWRNTAAQFVGPHGFLGLFVVNGPDSRLVLSIPEGSFAQFMGQPESERNAVIAKRAPFLADVPVRWDQVHNYRLFEHHAPSYIHGRTVLIGDAAHTFTPMLGLGMNLALEDADSLAGLLATKFHGEQLDDATLKRAYEHPRKLRNQRVLKRSREQGEFQVNSSPSRRAFFNTWCRICNLLPPVHVAAFRYLYR